jgi:hypothetical protein
VVRTGAHGVGPAMVRRRRSSADGVGTLVARCGPGVKGGAGGARALLERRKEGEKRGERRLFNTLFQSVWRGGRGGGFRLGSATRRGK